MNCEYEIEMSFDRKNQSNQSTKLISNTINLATIYECHRHFQFTESKDMNQYTRRPTNVVVFSFHDDKFEGMTNFLTEIVNRYNKRIRIESVYEITNRNLIYASPHYMNIMNIVNKETHNDYKHRRQTRSYSETDYFILREILKKNID
jgi:hypothetical protein